MSSDNNYVRTLLRIADSMRRNDMPLVAKELRACADEMERLEELATAKNTLLFTEQQEPPK